jgi:hypothetical protein
MTENQPEQSGNYVPIPTGVKGLKITVSESEKDKKIAELNEQIGHKDEIIQSYLVANKNKLEHEQYEAEKKKAEEYVSGKKPTICDPSDTAPLNAPKRQISAPIEIDPDCPIPLEAKGESVEQIIGFLKKNHENGNKDATRILDKLIRKSLKAGGTYEFSGNLAPTQMRNNKLVKVDRAKDNFYVKYSGGFKKVDDD